MKHRIRTIREKNRIQSQAYQKILCWQRWLADYLNQKCGNISRTAMLVSLIIFSTLISAALLRLVINAIH